MFFSRQRNAKKSFNPGPGFPKLEESPEIDCGEVFMGPQKHSINTF